MSRAFSPLIALVASILASPPIAAGHSCGKPVHDCLNTMVTKLKTTGFIGVELEENESTKALVVSKVIEGSPAAAAGIQPGDVLFALNGIRFDEENDAEMAKVKVPGNEVTCTIRRNGTSKQIKLTLVPMPADLMAKYIGEHMMEHATADASAAAKP